MAHVSLLELELRLLVGIRLRLLDGLERGRVPDARSERRAPLRARDDVALVLFKGGDLVLRHDVVDVVVVVAVAIAVARVLVARRVALALALGPI